MQSEEKRDPFSEAHPFVNFSYFVIVLGIGMFCLHPVLLIIAYIAALSYSSWLNGIRKTASLNGKFVLPGMLVVALVNPTFNHYGVTLLFTLENGNSITLESIIYGLILALVFAVTINWFAIVNQVMTRDKIVYLFGRILPASSLILAMVFRFVPKFSAQAARIRLGQQSIGRSWEQASWLQKVKQGGTIFSILLTWSLENAIETADSMKARGYGLKGRSAFAVYRFDRRNSLLLCALLAAAAALVWLFWQQGLTAQYNPQLLVAGMTTSFTPRDVLALGLYTAAANLPLGLAGFEAWQWRRALRFAKTDLDLPTYFYGGTKRDTIED